MAGLRIYVSSTCYDLSSVRSQLRSFIQSQGHEPLMSDYNDILYDPEIHTHTSCVDDIANSDIVILIIGSRFGGACVQEALSFVDLKSIEDEKSMKQINSKGIISITQLEVMAAITKEIPVFAFIDDDVWHDHKLYEKNKSTQVINEIIFPSIDNQKTASYIFDFIDFFRYRTKNNSVFTFKNTQDIEDVLIKQWAALLRKSIQGRRSKAIDSKRNNELIERIEDLKTVVLTSICSSSEREITKSILRFRRLMDFIISLNLKDKKFISKGSPTWSDLLKEANIEFVIEKGSFIDNESKTYLIKEDRTYYETTESIKLFIGLESELKEFVKLPEDTRRIIYDSLSDIRVDFGAITYKETPINNLILELCKKEYDNLLDAEAYQSLTEK